MSKYIDDINCPNCPEYIEPFGCTWHSCSIYIDYELGRAEIAGDEDHDKRKDARIEEEMFNEG